MIHEGAMAFLFREYRMLAIFIIVVFLLMFFSAGLGFKTGIAFISGALCSILAGFFGMQAATKANVRTSEAARSGGMAKALLVSYLGGSVMGLAVASLGLVGVGIFLPFLVIHRLQNISMALPWELHPLHFCKGWWRNLHKGSRCWRGSCG